MDSINEETGMVELNKIEKIILYLMAICSLCVMISGITFYFTFNTSYVDVVIDTLLVSGFTLVSLWVPLLIFSSKKINSK